MNGWFGWDSASSIKIKKDIAPLADDVYKILDLRPVAFKDRDSGRPGIGVIAEEADQLGLKNLVFYAQDGSVLSFDYDKVPLYYLQVVKDQRQRIKKINADNQELESELRRLEQRLSEMEKRMK